MSQVNRRKCSPPRRPDSWSDRYHPIRDYQVGLDVAETFFGNVLSCQNLFKQVKLWFYKLPAAGVGIEAVKLKKQMPEKA